MSATGMVGWLLATGRPDSRVTVYHSRVSQHMGAVYTAPVKGAHKAVMRLNEAAR